MNKVFDLIDKLEKVKGLTVDEYVSILDGFSPSSAEYIAEKADRARKEIYGNNVFIRGLIEISNICKNNCFYCGIRRDNANCQRYRLTKSEILDSCKSGYELGFRTFVLQGGEDGYFNDGLLCEIIKEIKVNVSDCAVTLSLGERSFESYKALYDAGADRYLLRHEAVSEDLYSALHPKEMLLSNRLECLNNLKKIGYQVGCGFMVGAPGQTNLHIAQDLKFIEEFKPDMCGIGPFIPHKDTIYNNEKSGTAEFTCYLLSIIRLVKPNILLPATTALGTVEKRGREKGILAGANVVMPNLSPREVRKKYDLYDNKISIGAESAENIKILKDKMNKIGFSVVIDRGDIKEI